ncbi:MAG TPA: HNH endonuclease [Nitrosopumilaceae archaeon]|jgi:hypothetical protein|nr:HNH endonuclease [Nitrosopumilaceae archaeon]
MKRGIKLINKLPTDNGEIWKPITFRDGIFKNLYAVSNKGRVWTPGRWVKIRGGQRFTGALFFKQKTTKAGYKEVCLTDNNSVEYHILVHQLVAHEFIGPCPRGKEVRHRNGKPGINRVTNLDYGTAQRNQHDRFTHGTDNRGEKSVDCKLTDKQVIKIRKLYYVGGITLKELAKEFKVHFTTICDICRGKTWKHLTGPCTKIWLNNKQRRKIKKILQRKPRTKKYKANLASRFNCPLIEILQLE